MALTQTLIENIPSTPDIAALSAMTDPIVVVTKISAIGNKRGNDQLIVNGQTGMSSAEILKLHDALPVNAYANSGPGLYRFEVTDQQSGAKMMWQIRLGGASIDNSEGQQLQQQRVGALSTPAAQFTPQRPVPPAPDAQSLGNGWVYNPALDLLTAPDGSLHNWRKGMPLPTLPSFAPLPTAQAPTTPFTPMPIGASPETELLRQQLTAMQSALNESRERERESQRQQEIRDLRESFAKTLDETNKRMETILATVARPQESGELTELKRRLESRDQLDAIRAETKATTDAMMALVRENSNKGIDPVVNMLTTMLTQQQATGNTSFQLLRDMATQERQTMLTMMDKQNETLKDSGSLDIVTKVMGGMDMIFDRLRQVTQLEREIAGGSGGGVDWMSVIKEVGSRAGSAVQAFQQAKTREAEAVQMKAQAEIAQAQASAIHDKAAVAINQRRQVAATPAKPAPAAAPALTSVPAPVAEETKPVAVSTPAAGASVTGTILAPAERPNKKKPDLSKATIKELRATFKSEPDDQFFGGFLEYVQQLRDEVATRPSAYSAEEIANYVLQAREYIAAEAQQGRVTHAAEIFAHGQVAYLIERILPEAAEGLHSEITKAVKRALAAEMDEARVAAAMESKKS